MDSDFLQNKSNQVARNYGQHFKYNSQKWWSFQNRFQYRHLRNFWFCLRKNVFAYYSFIDRMNMFDYFPILAPIPITWWPSMICICFDCTPSSGGIIVCATVEFGWSSIILFSSKRYWALFAIFGPIWKQLIIFSACHWYWIFICSIWSKLTW